MYYKVYVHFKAVEQYKLWLLQKKIGFIYDKILRRKTLQVIHIRLVQNGRPFPKTSHQKLFKRTNFWLHFIYTESQLLLIFLIFPTIIFNRECVMKAFMVLFENSKGSKFLGKNVVPAVETSTWVWKLSFLPGIPLQIRYLLGSLTSPKIPLSTVNSRSVGHECWRSIFFSPTLQNKIKFGELFIERRFISVVSKFDDFPEISWT